jgi:hypothetical protein
VGTLKRALKRLAKITQEVKAIGDLNSMWCASRRTPNVLRPTVTRDNLNTRMLLKPGLKERGAALRQQVDRPPMFQVEQDGAIALALSKRKIVNTEDTRRSDGRLRQVVNQAQQRVSAGRHMETSAHPRASSATKGEAKLQKCLTKPLGSLCRGFQEGTKAFRKRHGRTVGIVTAEASNRELKSDWQVGERTVLRDTLIGAMDAC